MTEPNHCPDDPSSSQPPLHLSEDDHLDSDIDSDKDNPILSSYRHRRMQEFQAEANEIAKKKATMGLREDSDVYGGVLDVRDEKVLLLRSSKEKLCIIHFYRQDFARCRTMNSHLESLAPRFPSTLFLKTSVENAPFLVNRLGVKILPCVIAFVDGMVVDRIIGFEGLGKEDDFSTSVLEARLKKCGVLSPLSKIESGQGRPQSDDEEDEGEEKGHAERKKYAGSIRVQRGQQRRGDGDEDDRSDDE